MIAVKAENNYVQVTIPTDGMTLWSPCLSREGQTEIARRFNAGWDAQSSQVPQGRLKFT
jgi:hypothetical protein